MCLRVHACARRESKQGFSASLRLVFHMGKSGTAPSSPELVHRAPVPKADPSCLPALPLSGDLRHSAEAPLQTHLPLSSEDRSSLCIFHLFWLMLLTYFACHMRATRAPAAAPPAALASQCFHRVGNQGLPQIMLCFNDT